VQAIRDVVQETGGSSPGKGEAALKPGFWNVFYLLLLTANLAFVVFLIPKSLVKDPHWDLLKEAIPVVGGSFFVVVASWYKDWTLRLCQMPLFRISQITLSIIFCLSLWIRWLPIHPLVHPPGADIFVDGEEDGRKASELLPLSLKPHFFRVKWKQEAGETDKPFLRHLTWRQTLLAAFGGEQPRWAQSYKVLFQCIQTPRVGASAVPGQTAGVSVRIVPDEDSRFDEEFLKSDLFDYNLQAGPIGSLSFVLPNHEAPADATYLPAGTYTFTPYMHGCQDGRGQHLSVGPNSDGMVKVKFEALQCH
jgi:hypothetical protein